MTALAFAWGGLMLGGCTERPTEPLVASKPLAEIGPQVEWGLVAGVKSDNLVAWEPGVAQTLTGDYADYPDNRLAISWAWGVQVTYPEDLGYSFSAPNSQTTDFTPNDAGSYHLTLVVCVEGADLEPVCSAPANFEVFVEANEPPVAKLAVVGGQTTVAVGEEICFDGSASFDPEGSLLSFFWEFGDGSTMTGKSAPCHTYASAGTYTVGLEVKDDHESNDWAYVTVTVTPTIQSLMNDVTTLVSSGLLSADRGDGLLTKLSAAVTSLNNDLTADACKQLKAFENQVRASIKAKKLTSTDGQALIASSVEIRTQIGCP